MTKVITVANRKGGAGKSTCAAHFALEAVSKGLKVMLIDLDPQKTLEGWWEKREEENPYLAEATALTLVDKIEKIKENGFDICIIDTPGDTSANAQAGIMQADLIVIPSKPTAPDLTAIGNTISMVKEHNKNYLFVITQAISRTKVAFEAVSVLSEFGTVAPSTISNRVSYQNAMSAGESACSFDKAAEQEISTIWNYIYSSLTEKKGDKNGKEKF